MKKLLLLFVFFALGRMAFGQELDFKFKIDSTGTGDFKKYSVTISVTKGNAPYSYFVYEGDPSKNKIFKKSTDEIFTDSFLVEGILPKRSYFVVLHENKTDAKYVIKQFRF